MIIHRFVDFSHQLRLDRYFGKKNTNYYQCLLAFSRLIKDFWRLKHLKLKIMYERDKCNLMINKRFANIKIFSLRGRHVHTQICFLSDVKVHVYFQINLEVCLMVINYKIYSNSSKKYFLF